MRLLANIEGQGTVEAAVVIPVLFVVMLMMLQPGIVLYDYSIMRSAAAEGARLLATSSAGEGVQGCEDFIRNRLSAVPQQELFHVHDEGCSWNIELVGDESSESVEVTISNELRPLPFLDLSLRLLGIANEEGNLEISVRHEEANQPPWVEGSQAKSPQQWVEQW